MNPVILPAASYSDQVHAVDPDAVDGGLELQQRIVPAGEFADGAKAVVESPPKRRAQVRITAHCGFAAEWT